MLTICHNATARNEDYITHVAEEQCMLRFADQFNYGFVSSIPNTDFHSGEDKYSKIYETKLANGNLVQHKVFLVNEPRHKSDRFSILVKESKSNTYILYARGSYENMESIIEFNKNSMSYKKVIKANKDAGLHCPPFLIS